jgi:hypothetical protein
MKIATVALVLAFAALTTAQDSSDGELLTILSDYEKRKRTLDVPLHFQVKRDVIQLQPHYSVFKPLDNRCG